MSTIGALRDEILTGRPAVSPEYAAKQLHAIPAAPVVVRETFLLERCQDKRVFELGATGPMHDAIVKAARHVIGIDRHASDGVLAFDLDDVRQTELPCASDFPEIVLCGEVLEHLGNPGYVLQRIRRQYQCPLIVTAPNAFCEGGRKFVSTGIENVNLDHVAWYSWKTLTTLLGRYGFTVTEFAWYKGQPRVAEGLIVVAE